MSTTRFKTNMNNLRSEASNFEQGGSGNWVKLIDGKNMIRIMPPWSNAGKFFQRVGFHKEPGDQTGKKPKVVCPNFTFGKDNCPICKKSKQVYEQYGKDVAKNYWPQKRAYINVLDMKAADGIVKVLEVGGTILNPILNFMAEEDSDTLVDLNLGYNIMVRKYKESNFTKYEVMIKPGVFDIKAHGYDIEAILTSLPDLSLKVKMPNPDDFYDILEKINEATFQSGGQPGQDVDQGDSTQDVSNRDDIPPGPGRAKPPQGQQTQPQTRRPTKVEDEGDDLPQARPTGQNRTVAQTASQGAPQNRPEQNKLTDAPAATEEELGDIDLNIDADFTTDDIPF